MHLYSQVNQNIALFNAGNQQEADRKFASVQEQVEDMERRAGTCFQEQADRMDKFVGHVNE